LDEAWDDPIEYVLGKAIKETFNNLEEINFEKSSVRKYLRVGKLITDLFRKVWVKSTKKIIKRM